MIVDRKEEINEFLTPLISEFFKKLGFKSKDGMRFYRRSKHLIHYFILFTEKLSKKIHGSRVDGVHVNFVFGEFLDYTPDLSLSAIRRMNLASFNESINPFPFAKKSHYKKAAEKIKKAVSDIESERFSRIAEEIDYVDFHLRSSPSMEKVYFLTLSEQHEEANAWLHLILHKYKGLKEGVYDSDKEQRKVYFDEVENSDMEFFKLSLKERKKHVLKVSEMNIKNNDLEFLYETV